MESQSPNPPYAVPPPFSPPLSAHRSFVDTNPMDLDNIKMDHDRSQRAASVLSGMSVEDMEAAETLNSLHAKYHSPRHTQPLPTHVETSTAFDANQPEPILRLVTSQYPLAASLINGSLSAYKTTQSYIPGAEWTERHVGLPIAGTVARISGVEGGLRWALQPKRDGRASNTPISTPDVEKGFVESTVSRTNRSSSDGYSESLPAYNAGDRSPPYSEEQLATQSRERQRPPPGWRQQLVISTSGLGIAMSEESLRSLRYCLSWLRWANGRLGEAIQNLKALVERWDDGPSPNRQGQPGSSDALTQQRDERRQAALSARIAALRTDVLQTLKQVVGIVSEYAGGALPENARNLVHRHLTSLPQRFSLASAMSNNTDPNADETANSANRVMVLAQEGLDMMTQVSRVVNDTLVSAEGWCEKLGRKTGRDQSQQHQLANAAEDDKSDPRDRSETIGQDQQDVKMEM